MYKKYETNLYKSKIKSLKKKWLYEIYREKTIWKIFTSWVKDYPELIYCFPKEFNSEVKWIECN